MGRFVRLEIALLVIARWVKWGVRLLKEMVRVGNTLEEAWGSER
jgi:hypothetical protein